ncbi:MAG: hypothetical protein KAU48_11005, partial [Candidatus Thorarchaeota archaeon]|nr:hypothetical protein [Candidatus Thorarchaeota archaeon]
MSEENCSSADCSPNEDYSKFKGIRWRMGLVAAASVVWIVARSVTKPSRITYPCQQIAVGNIHSFLAVLLAPMTIHGKVKATLVVTTLLLGSLFLTSDSILLTTLYTPFSADNNIPVPLTLSPQTALASDNSSDLFFIQNVSGIEGNMDLAVSELVSLMEDQQLYFYKNTSQPSGLIGNDDIVMLKVNCQWSSRGGTNTDLVKSLIDKIVSHPEGFTGEIVIADNGQGHGSLD